MIIHSDGIRALHSSHLLVRCSVLVNAVLGVLRRPVAQTFHKLIFLYIYFLANQLPEFFWLKTSFVIHVQKSQRVCHRRLTWQKLIQSMLSSLEGKKAQSLGKGISMHITKSLSYFTLRSLSPPLYVERKDLGWVVSQNDYCWPEFKIERKFEAAIKKEEGKPQGTPKKKEKQ